MDEQRRIMVPYAELVVERLKFLAVEVGAIIYPKTSSVPNLQIRLLQKKKKFIYIAMMFFNR